jgi:hypothetical protein
MVGKNKVDLDEIMGKMGITNIFFTPEIMLDDNGCKECRFRMYI